MSEEGYNYPPVLRLSLEDVESCKICLCDDGINLFLYIVDIDWVDENGGFDEGEYNEDGLREDGIGG